MVLLISPHFQWAWCERISVHMFVQVQACNCTSTLSVNAPHAYASHSHLRFTLTLTVHTHAYGSHSRLRFTLTLTVHTHAYLPTIWDNPPFNLSALRDNGLLNLLSPLGNKRWNWVGINQLYAGRWETGCFLLWPNPGLISDFWEYIISWKGYICRSWSSFPGQ